MFDKINLLLTYLLLYGHISKRPSSDGALCSGRILLSQIMRHYTRHKFINPLQHGFQKGLSCESQLAITVDQLQKRLDDKQQIDLIILDFQKAFDKLPHRHLLHKLHESGIHGQLHEWLTCYFTERTQRVIVDGCESTEARVMSGVPQGTV